LSIYGGYSFFIIFPFNVVRISQKALPVSLPLIYIYLNSFISLGTIPLGNILIAFSNICKNIFDFIIYSSLYS